MSLILKICKDGRVFVSLIISLGLSVSEENIIEPTCTKLDNIIKVYVSVPDAGTGQSGEAAIGESRVALIIFWVETK